MPNSSTASIALSCSKSCQRVCDVCSKYNRRIEPRTLEREIVINYILCEVFFYIIFHYDYFFLISLSFLITILVTVLISIITIISLLIIIVVAGAVYLSSNLDHFIQVLTTQIEDNTGRKFVVGAAEIDLSFHPELEIKDVSLANAEWGSRKEMVKAESLLIRVNLPALLLGDILFDEIQFIVPAVVSENLL